MAMKSELQEMVQELEKAFNESVCESGRIAEVLAGIKAAGYDVLLALDVTVGVADDPDFLKETSTTQPEPAREPLVSSNGELVLTDADMKFLEGLQIAG